MKRPVYLDYAATTPVDPRVAACMMQYLTHEHEFGNPASQHAFGLAAKQSVEHARAQIAALLNADPSEIIFTSGATESINLAIKGAVRMYQRKGRHIVTMKTEHKAVLDTCQTLEKEGYNVTYLLPEANGKLNLDTLRDSLRADTILVSIMHVNNETGVIQDLAAIANETSARGILLHVDAAQSAGKLPLNVAELPIDLLSLSAHKAYGPKGAGALYLRKKPRVRVEPLIHGGGQEQGMRSGTLPTHQIVGMGEAFAIAAREMENDYQHMLHLRSQFLAGLQDVPQIILNTNITICSPYIINFRFQGMLADAILQQMPEIAVSTASACQGKGAEGSYVLRAMGLSDEQTKSSVRFSFGRFVTHDDVKLAVELLRKRLSS